MAQATTALGKTASEEEAAELGRHSLYWRRALAPGDTVTEDDLTALRPAGGLAPVHWRLVVGHRVARPVAAGAAVAPGDVE